jgi:MFS family permease
MTRAPQPAPHPNAHQAAAQYADPVPPENPQAPDPNPQIPPPPPQRSPIRTAIRLIAMLGVVSLCADLCYEGARGINGSYLALLGASATAVGIAAGLGEFVGYALRLASGYLADRLRAPWLLVFLGYSLSVIAVPLMALAPNWQTAAALIVVERLGKAIRGPARDALLSAAAKPLGQGKGFGLHESLDQFGAVAGPLLASGVFAWSGKYQIAFAVFAIPALACIAALALARRTFANADEPRVKPAPTPAPLGSTLWLAIIACGLIALGTPDFALLAFHFKSNAAFAATFPEWAIPMLYAGAMAVDAFGALGLGWLFDRFGIIVVAITTAIGAAASPLLLLGNPTAAIVGMVVWGIALASQESIMRAMIATLAPPDRKGWTFGIFYVVFGLAWLAGSAAMGALYDLSITAVAILGITATLASFPILTIVARRTRAPHT